MLISFVYPVFDDRAVRGIREGSEPKLIEAGEPKTVHWKAVPKAAKKKQGEGALEPREWYAFGLGPTRPLHPRPGRATGSKSVLAINQWDRSWPKVTFVADVRRQGRFVSSVGETRAIVRPALRLKSASVQPRTARQYTFHQSYLALFSFSFLFHSKARHEEVMDAVRALRLQLVEFRLGSPAHPIGSADRNTFSLEPVVALSNCTPHLARLHATSAFSERHNPKNIAHLTSLQPLIFVHDANLEIEDWPVSGPVTCQALGQSLTFALRPREKCTTWALQSFVCAQILEGEAIQRMTEYVIKDRRILTEKKEKWRKRAAASSISSSAKARDDALEAIPASVRNEIGLYFSKGKNGALDEAYDATIKRLKRLGNAETRDALKGMMGVKV